MSGPTPKKAELGPPPRWFRCPRRGQPVAGKFVPFKTTLCSLYDSQIPEGYRFGVSMVFNQMKIGLWIDLTNTDRFYSPEEVEKHGAHYVKLHCKGHSECPSVEQTNTFITICKNFFREHPTEFVGVHCTHGFNRTGFLISSYLIMEQDWSVEAAINEFATRRPPGIYKQDYIDELCKRYGDPQDIPMAPALPDWCDDSEPILDDNEAEGSASSSSGASGNKKNGKAEFAEGVQGVTWVSDKAKSSQLQRLCQEWCGWQKNGFPGSQPVSMDIENIMLLQETLYKVSWKADGVRYMTMMNGRDEVYMFDRDNNVFHVPNVRFPHRKEPDRDLQQTLVDGELIFDEVDGKKYPRYLIYDIIRFENMPLYQNNFDIRLLCIRKEIIEPREKAKQEGTIDRSLEPFSVRMKDFWDITTVEKILSPAFRQNGVHEFDGLIFQPVPDPYEPGRCRRVLKWKPHDLNSVDFKLKLVKDVKEGMLPQWQGYLYVLHKKEAFDVIRKVTRELQQYDNKIIECTWDQKQGWKFLRERKDKSFPNAYDTAMGVCKSIQHPITKELLIKFVQSNAKKPQPQQQPKRPGPEAANGQHAQAKRAAIDGQMGERSLMPPPSLPP